MDNFAEHMFTEAVRAEQAKIGVDDRFQRMYRNRFTDGIDADVRAFVQSRTSFYMATVSETGWPYVQHRGGPVGFLKVFDTETIAFADYTGNKQLISKGYLSRDDRVSLFLMDYPRRARLKMIGHATMIDAAEAPDLATRLAVEGAGVVERLVTIRVTAFDWNCPKYIEPRFTEAEIEAMLGPRLKALAEENATLRAALTDKERKS